MKRLPALLIAALSSCLLSRAPTAAASLDSEDVYSFDDFPRETPLEYPDWFKDSFLYLNDDLQDAIEAGKSGLMVYFGQRRCAYCHKLMDVNFGQNDIVEYTKRHFDVVPIDIWGVREVTGFDGKVHTEREFSLGKDTNFTPSIIFFDKDGREALRLRGYYPPYQFRAALEYVADRHYLRESFRDYLARGEGRMVFDAQDLNDEDFFTPPPFNLDRSRFPSERPLAVFFEQGECHACDVLHGQALREPAIYRLFEEFDNVQLDMWSNTRVVTPSGERKSARKWAAELGLFYAPSIVFFDEKGREILRVDSVVRFYRLTNVLNYISSKAYLTESYAQWRVSQAL
jgi:thioredoxin-related protein